MPDPCTTGYADLLRRIEAIEARHLREDEEEAWRSGTTGIESTCSFLRFAGISEEKIAEYERRFKVRV
jgi:hypothetical protein